MATLNSLQEHITTAINSSVRATFLDSTPAEIPGAPSQLVSKVPASITLADSLEETRVADDIKSRNIFPNSHHESIYRGKLTPACVAHYHRLYIGRSVPPRRYPYHHEIAREAAAKEDNSDVKKLDWRIVGGEQVDIRRAPYAVLYGLYCGGTLISPDWVITAAHCKTNDEFVIAGSTTQFDGIRYPICAHFLHPKWNMTNKLHYHDFDYQLLLLEQPVPVTAWSRPIAIGQVNDIRAGEMVTISGWGHTQTKQKQMQNAIRQVAVPVIPHIMCQALAHKYYKTITPRMFCAGYLQTGGKDSCQGDSGGPVVLREKLVGLVSFGVGCAEPNNPGVYTNIPLARAWIREVTGLPL